MKKKTIIYNVNLLKNTVYVKLIYMYCTCYNTRSIIILHLSNEVADEAIDHLEVETSMS